MQEHAHARFARQLPPAISSTEATDDGSLAALFDARQPVQHVRPGGVILLHGAAADHVYRVVSGTVRCCTINENGQRQIFRFVRKGEFLGFVEADRWHFTAEAVDHVILSAAPRATVERALDQSLGLQRALRAHMARELAAREHQMLSLVYMTAEQRLLTFLTDFANHRTPSGFTVLPMTRQDVGDHLGLALESVSRALGVLKRKGAIEMNGTSKYRVAGEIRRPLAA